MYEFIKDIMFKASEIILGAENIGNNITVKSGDANYVTAYDVAVENYLIQNLTKNLPGAEIIGEEEAVNHTENLSGKLAIIIDPIDGTTNFIHNRRYSAISVGICDHGEMIFGAVYDPYSDRLYSAEKGRGTLLTVKKGSPVELKMTEKPLSECLAAFGTSPYYRDELAKKTFATAYNLFMHTHDIRRSGSAALDLASIAGGEIDIFFEYRLSPWDFAAGSLLIEEAGGIATDMNGDKLKFDKPSPVLCGNRLAHEQWLEFIKEEKEL